MPAEGWHLAGSPHSANRRRGVHSLVVGAFGNSDRDLFTIIDAFGGQGPGLRVEC